MQRSKTTEQITKEIEAQESLLDALLRESGVLTEIAAVQQPVRGAVQQLSLEERIRAALRVAIKEREGDGISDEELDLEVASALACCRFYMEYGHYSKGTPCKICACGAISPDGGCRPIGVLVTYGRDKI